MKQNSNKITLIIVASLVFLSSFLVIRRFYISELQIKLGTLIQANQMMAHYQGMKFDLAGMGPFINFHIEKSEDFDLHYLKIQSSKNIFERTYDSGSKVLLNRTVIKVVEGEVILNAILFLTERCLAKMLFLTCIIGSLIFGIFYYVKLIFDVRKSKEFAYLAKQVSHDIRSPLAALNVAISSLDGIDEDSKVLIHSAYRRINDIANNLLTHSRSSNSLQKNKKHPVLLSRLLETIVSEKRILVSGDKISFFTNYDKSALDVFSYINKVEFERVISNLINNSIEALEESGGWIEISLKFKSELIVTIKDNGPGISEAILKNIGHGQVTSKNSSKTNFGLGLSHAYKTLYEISGKIAICSSEGKGTTISLTIPVCNSPIWFKKKIILPEGCKVAILDDDQSIHSIWKEKLKLSQVELFHFYDPETFKAWHATTENKNIFLLCDYDFSGIKLNGMELIRELNLQNTALLVSSFFDDDSITEECVSSHIKGLPKSFAKFVEFEIIDHGKKYDLVLIDDDKYVRMAWEGAATSEKCLILALDSVESFLSHSESLSKEVPVFIDSNLGEGIKGEIVSKKIFDLNFKNLYLATGYSKEDIEKPYWIKEVVGKDPKKYVKAL